MMLRIFYYMYHTLNLAIIVVPSFILFTGHVALLLILDDVWTPSSRPTIKLGKAIDRALHYIEHSVPQGRFRNFTTEVLMRMHRMLLAPK